MAAITAAAVMALREKTGLPMMECKKALTECGGDTDQAVEWLRKQGVKTQAMRADRETSMGRLAVYTDLDEYATRNIDRLVSPGIVSTFCPTVKPFQASENRMEH